VAKNRGKNPRGSSSSNIWVGGFLRAEDAVLYLFLQLPKKMEALLNTFFFFLFLSSSSTFLSLVFIPEVAKTLALYLLRGESPSPLFSGYI
jgi:hypothetical protein